MTIEYTKLESIHSALQELQNKYEIPNEDVDLKNALQFTEDLREPHLKENEDAKLTSDNLEKIFNYIDSQLADKDIGEFDEETPILSAVDRTIEMFKENEDE